MADDVVKVTETTKEYELLKKEGLDSIENLRSKANSAEEKKERKYIGIAKHLCGGATDLTI